MEPLESEVLESSTTPKYSIDWKLYQRLKYLGIIHASDNEVDIRSFNIGNSDYSKHTIQPWSIWLDYPDLTSWDHDIIKRVLRTKKGESRSLDYEKIIQICQERLRQLRFQHEENVI